MKRFDFFDRAALSSDGYLRDARGLGASSAASSTSNPHLVHPVLAALMPPLSFALKHDWLLVGDAAGSIARVSTRLPRPSLLRYFSGKDSQEDDEKGIHFIDVLKRRDTVFLVIVRGRTVSLATLPPGDDVAPEAAATALRRTGVCREALSSYLRGSRITSLSTCLDPTNSDRFRMLCGFSDGSVGLFQASLAPEDAQGDACLSGVLRASSSIPVFVGFSEDVIQSFWVVTKDSVTSFDMDARVLAVVDRSEGSETASSVCWRGRDGGERMLICARKDRVAYYTVESPGSCYAVEGEKSHICPAAASDTFAILVSGDAWSAPRLTGERGVAETSGSSSALHTLQLMDLSNKFIAHEFTLSPGETAWFLGGEPARGTAWLLTSHRALWRFTERSLASQLEELVARNLYSTAISLAESRRASAEMLAGIHLKHAEHLYEKADFEGASLAYVETIGHAEPSSVIRRFLDAPRVGDLARYLRALHERASAQLTPDHTTLLLSCYVRLATKSREEEEEAAEAIRGLLKRPGVDVDAALSVLQASGGSWTGVALELAETKERHAWFLKTLIESNEDSESRLARALEYLARLPSPLAKRALLLEHAGALFKRAPEETMRVCLDALRPGEEGFGDAQEERFVESLLDRLSALNRRDVALSLLGSLTPEQTSRYLSARAWMTWLHLVVNRDEEAPKDAEVLHVLRRIPETSSSLREALSVLESAKRPDLVASEQWLLIKLEDWPALLETHMQQDSAEGDEAAFQVCKTRDEGRDSKLWTAALSHFARHASRRSSSADALRASLRHIESQGVGDRILPPLLALKVISQANPSLPFSLIKPYLMGQLERATKTAKTDEREAAANLEEARGMRAKAEELRTQPKLFTNPTCALTGSPLEFPVVHFASGNSYNLASLPASASEGGVLRDPKCAAEQLEVREIARGLTQRRGEADEDFYREMESARGEEGFNVAADFFGKALFDHGQS